MELGIALVGFGNVAQGLARILIRKRDLLTTRYGIIPVVKAVVTGSKGTLWDPSGLDLEAVLDSMADLENLSGVSALPATIDEILKGDEISVVVDTTPTDLVTGEPGLSIIKRAIESGKHVVSSSKGPVSVALPELTDLATRHGVAYRFEGALLSGTPSINLAMEAMAGCDVVKVQGIVNGTTNYILTRMEEGMGYEDALAEAQDRGYAETDPSGDVDGWDAAVKAQIIASVIMGEPISLDQVERRGISEISRSDVLAALDRGNRIKLIAQVERRGRDVVASVSPMELPLDHPLAGVMGATNAITYETDNLKDVTIVGPGAGREETGQALLADLLAIFRERGGLVVRRSA
ncbi:Homoserine dehydrogenase [Dethiosulfovibrio peptidovorans DSM 11002]|uniref:Homoserine dehydrogenase n=1 Tax=Dethiosulfovibrio peptidovorans DSM 11002 TaxID=469381 RepID=D2Z7Q5_9BACT|nr:homoserine dehydrogenase [Dethiosulfovibrio peptidovorans]EFC91502.1 Homoserine dehydrogenase [Dethiosulfovibrio peptidovorans DSM 11002]